MSNFITKVEILIYSTLYIFSTCIKGLLLKELSKSRIRIKNQSLLKLKIFAYKTKFSQNYIATEDEIWNTRNTKIPLHFKHNFDIYS